MQPGSSLANQLGAWLGGVWSVRGLNASGFCATWQARQGERALFVKSAPLAHADVVEAEADGLSALAETRTIRVPSVAGCWRDEAAGTAVLAMEFLALAAPDAQFGARFGAALAQLHAATPGEGGGRFGWRRDNLIGATPQGNRWSEGTATAGWIAFLRSERLQPMRDRLAARHPQLAEATDAVCEALPKFFADGHVPRASLIHGDLWSGNWGMLADGTPVIYDPAVSCSDAEAELAMMELFGAPPPGFWQAYRGACALHAGYRRRRALYQLYHLLNHAVIFGGGYVQQANALARSLARGA